MFFIPTMRRLLLAATLLLTGCAGFNPFGPGPVDPQDTTAKPGLVLTGSGVQKFQCSADKDGYWWRFIAPEVVLTDKTGRRIATQGADFNFTAPDKSKLASKIVSSAPGKTDADLKDVLFKVTPAGATPSTRPPRRNSRADPPITLNFPEESACGRVFTLTFRRKIR